MGCSAPVSPLTSNSVPMIDTGWHGCEGRATARARGSRRRIGSRRSRPATPVRRSATRVKLRQRGDPRVRIGLPPGSRTAVAGVDFFGRGHHALAREACHALPSRSLPPMSPGHNGCLCGLDPSVPYEGPSAAIATLGGSPTWGLGDRFHELAAEQGHARLGVHRPRTPYGLGPQVEHYRAPGGRSSSASRPTARSSARTRCSARASGRRSGSSGGRACGSSWSAAPAGAATGGGARATRTPSARVTSSCRGATCRATRCRPGSRVPSSSSVSPARSRSWTTPSARRSRERSARRPIACRGSASGASTAPREASSSIAGLPATASSRWRAAGSSSCTGA